MEEMSDREDVAQAKVLWGIGLRGSGSVEEWMPHGYEASDVDWLVSTPSEAIEMLDAADRIADERAGSRRSPKLEIVIDEAADVLGYEGTDPERRALRERIRSRMSAWRPIGVNVTVSSPSPAPGIA